MYFENCTTAEELKKRYKKLVFKLHPDTSNYDSKSDFQRMQNEFESLWDALKDTHKTEGGKTYTATQKSSETAKEYSAIILALLKLSGVEIEIIGCFLWLSGNTKEHKEAIKSLGFCWAKNKSMWYLAPKDYVAKSRRAYSIDEIRSRYGSEMVGKVDNNKSALCG